jgi:prepilin-type N-terminal cleavage/methylation domain-containing protein
MNQRGFTLTEVMIAGSILVIAGFFFVRAMMTNTQNRSTARKLSDLNQWVVDFTTTLENENTCKETFKGLSLGGTVLDVVDSAMTYFVVDQEMTNYKGLKIKKIEIQNVITNIEDSYFILQVDLEQKTAKAGKLQQITKYFPVKAYFDSGAVTTCSTAFLEEKNKALSCQKLGGTWNVANAGIPAFCDYQIEAQNCLATGGSWNASLQKCIITGQQTCTDIGGTWVNGKCES